MNAPTEMSAVKLALLAHQLREQTDDADVLAAEPIAIIGMGCRFPGGANSPDAYWELLRDGVDAVSEIPPDRWGPGGVPPGDAVWHAGLVDGLDRFDPRFFNISAREAASLDPQQR